MYDKRPNRVKNWKLIFAGGCALVISGAGVGLFLFSFLSSERVVVAADSSPVVAEQTFEQSAWIPELPVRLIIPAIEVDAYIQHIGLNADNNKEMDVPSNFTDVGWYEPGVRPGMQGSAVIAGHYNGKDVPEAVFYNLDNLQIGDEVVIMSAERIEDIFRVVKIETYAYDEATTEVFLSDDGKARLNLITCGGQWLVEENVYDTRTVIFTEQLTNVE